MGRTGTDQISSSYYPPRARWYSPVLRPWFRLRRALHLEKIQMPVGFTAGQMILSLLLPGFALFVNGRKKTGLAFVGIYLASVVCYVVWSGFVVSAVGFGLMISIHASSIVFLQSCTLRDKFEFTMRFLVAVGTLFIVWLAVYRPAAGFVQANWWTPMVVQGEVVVMRPVKFNGSVQRGERLFYALGSERTGTVYTEGGVRIRSGFGWGPVLAVAGDTILFSTNAFFVNGAPHARLPHMPSAGEVVLPEKHWFIWPQLDISGGHGNVGEEAISSAMLGLAVVSEEQFVGKPFERWFWRRQISP